MRADNRQSKIDNRPGFTLVEMLLVISIVVILATIVGVTSMDLTKRDGVRRGSDMVMGALSQAKVRALLDRRNTGVRLRLRVRNGEIPPNILANLTDEKGNRPPVLPIKFSDLNNPALNNVGPGRAVDLNGNGYIDPNDLFHPIGMGGWAADVMNNPVLPADTDGNGFVDDIVVCDQIEFVQQPDPYVDGWVWGRAIGNPIQPARVFVPASNAPAYPPLVPVDLPGTPPGSPSLPAPLIPLLGRILYEPYCNPPYSANPLVQWTDAMNAQHPPQRPSGLVRAMLNQEIQLFDVVEINGGGQTYVIVPFLPQFPQGIVPPQQPTLPGGVILDRPLETDVPPPMNGQPNYRILRRPRVLPEKPISLPTGIQINMTGQLGSRPSGPNVVGMNANGQYWDRGLTNDIPGPFQELNGDVVIDILFTPDGRLLGTATDGMFLWVCDTTEANADNQRIVALGTRTGAVGVYGVYETSGNPYYHVQTARTDE